MGAVWRGLSRLGAGLVAGLLALFGLLLMLGAVIVGAAALLGWLVWARWQGRPAPSVAWPPRRGGNRVPRDRSPMAARPSNDPRDIIDVPVREVREVPEPPQGADTRR
ncbi:MAG: hypothetical protein ABIX12_05150 [Rubrivivax sp.]